MDEEDYSWSDYHLYSWKAAVNSTTIIDAMATTAESTSATIKVC